VIQESRKMLLGYQLHGLFVGLLLPGLFMVDEYLGKGNRVYFVLRRISITTQHLTQ